MIGATSSGAGGGQGEPGQRKGARGRRAAGARADQRLKSAHMTGIGSENTSSLVLSQSLAPPKDATERRNVKEMELSLNVALTSCSSSPVATMLDAP